MDYKKRRRSVKHLSGDKTMVRSSLFLLGSLFITGCMMNPTPNAGQFHMSDAETKAAQFNAMQTKAMDRASIREDQLLRKEGLRNL